MPFYEQRLALAATLLFSVACHQTTDESWMPAIVVLRFVPADGQTVASGQRIALTAQGTIPASNPSPRDLAAMTSLVAESGDTLQATRNIAMQPTSLTIDVVPERPLPAGKYSLRLQGGLPIGFIEDLSEPPYESPDGWIESRFTVLSD